MNENNDYKIATITLNCKINNCELDLINVGKYLEIDDDIVGIKYSYGNVSFSKGVYLTSLYKKSKYKKSKINQKLFYNQISLIVKHTNVKLFQNGTLHITGCKSTDDGHYITELLCQKLKKLKDKTTPIILTTNEYNIALDCNNFIYSHINKNVIGYYDINQKIYYINNNEYIYSHYYKNLISKQEKNKIKKICNHNGIIIGEIKNLNKYDTKNKNHDKNYDKIKVTLHKELNNKLINEKLKDPISIIDYKCNPHITDTDYQIYVDVNCINVTLSLNTKINGHKLFMYLSDNQYICIYNPDVYSGIKFIFKYPMFYNSLKEQNITGICNCNIKCVCSNITFLIFQTGNVIISGFKSMKEIDTIISIFKNILKNYIEKS